MYNVCVYNMHARQTVQFDVEFDVQPHGLIVDPEQRVNFDSV